MTCKAPPWPGSRTQLTWFSDCGQRSRPARLCTAAVSNPQHCMHGSCIRPKHAGYRNHYLVAVLARRDPRYCMILVNVALRPAAASRWPLAGARATGDPQKVEPRRLFVPCTATAHAGAGARARQRVVPQRFFVIDRGTIPLYPHDPHAPRDTHRHGAAWDR